MAAVVPAAYAPEQAPTSSKQSEVMAVMGELGMGDLVNLLAHDRDSIVVMALREIERRCRVTGSEDLDLIYECGGLEFLADHICSTNADVQEQAVRVIVNLAVDDQLRADLCEYEIVELFVQLLEHVDQSVTGGDENLLFQLCTLGLSNLSSDETANEILRAQEVAPAVLSGLCKSSDPVIQERVSGVFANLVQHYPTLLWIAREKVFLGLMRILLTGESINAVARATEALSVLVYDSHGKKEFLASRGALVIVQALKRHQDEPRKIVHILSVVAALCDTAHDRMALRDHDAVDVILPFLRIPDAQVLSSALWALGALADAPEAKTAIATEDSLTYILKFLGLKTVALRTQAVGLLAEIASEPMTRELLLMNHCDALESLVTLLADQDQVAGQTYAAQVIGNIVFDDEIRIALIKKGVIDSLAIVLASSEDDFLLENALVTVAALASDQISKTILGRKGLLVVICDILDSRSPADDTVTVAGFEALATLTATNEDNRSMILANDLLQGLRECFGSESGVLRSSDIANAADEFFSLFSHAAPTSISPTRSVASVESSETSEPPSSAGAVKKMSLDDLEQELMALADSSPASSTSVPIDVEAPSSSTVAAPSSDVQSSTKDSKKKDDGKKTKGSKSKDKKSSKKKTKGSSTKGSSSSKKSKKKRHRHGSHKGSSVTLSERKKDAIKKRSVKCVLDGNVKVVRAPEGIDFESLVILIQAKFKHSHPFKTIKFKDEEGDLVALDDDDDMDVMMEQDGKMVEVYLFDSDEAAREAVGDGKPLPPPKAPSLPPPTFSPRLERSTARRDSGTYKSMLDAIQSDPVQRLKRVERPMGERKPTLQPRDRLLIQIRSGVTLQKVPEKAKVRRRGRKQYTGDASNDVTISLFENLLAARRARIDDDDHDTGGGADDDEWE